MHRAAHARHEIAAFAIAATCVGARLGLGGGVIDDPQFVQGVHREHNQVQLGMVVDRIHMRPITAALRPSARSFTGIA